MKNRELFSTKYVYLAGVLFALNFLYFSAMSQNQALVNQGCNIYVEGDGLLTGDQSIYVGGDYVNLSLGLSNGRIEAVGGKIFITQDWINYAGNNVFTNIHGNDKDGVVTLGSLTNTQIIAGFNSTHFENLYVFGSRKNMALDTEVNGRFTIDAVFDLLGNDLTIDNFQSTAITYQSGFIKSESQPNYGFVHWNIGSNLGTYSVPFGSDIDYPNNDLNLTLNVKSAMSSSDLISFATYPTDDYNNPLPQPLATPLETEIKKTVDRFWIIKPSNPFNKPNVEIVFSYIQSDISPTFNSIDDNNLKAIRNNTDIGKWLDMNPAGYESNSTVIAEVNSFDFYDYWTLINPPAPLANFLIPDAFTPNGDGTNDEFLPVFHYDYEIITYDFYIYDRWGRVVFYSNDNLTGWDGTINGKDPVIAVYSWVIIVKGKYADNIDGDGVKEKHVGKVTLYK